MAKLVAIPDHTPDVATIFFGVKNILYTTLHTYTRQALQVPHCL